MALIGLTKNIYDRTVLIKLIDSLGNNSYTQTAFIIDYKDKQFLITARHLFFESKLKIDPSIYNVEPMNFIKGEIAIYKSKGWHKFDCTAYHCSGNIDISVLLPIGEKIFETFNTSQPELSANGLIVGQEVLFLGYPYFSQLGKDYYFENGRPLPLVKKGGVMGMGGSEGEIFWFIDGMNNRGFSGSPICFHPLPSSTEPLESSTKNISIFGVMCQRKLGKEMNDDHEANTGIAIAYNIKHALKLINEIILPSTKKAKK